MEYKCQILYIILSLVRYFTFKWDEKRVHSIPYNFLPVLSPDSHIVHRASFFYTFFSLFLHFPFFFLGNRIFFSLHVVVSGETKNTCEGFFILFYSFYFSTFSLELSDKLEKTLIPYKKSRKPANAQPQTVCVSGETGIFMRRKVLISNSGRI